MRRWRWCIAHSSQRRSGKPTRTCFGRGPRRWSVAPLPGRNESAEGPRQVERKRPLARTSQVAFSGGGGNRTRVPWHFGYRFYVCSLLIPDVFLVAFVAGGSNKRDSPVTIEQVFSRRRP